jgi:hypothetical protein
MSDHTPGPWLWVSDMRYHGARLCSRHWAGVTVLDAVRHGMQDATVRFNVEGIMHKAEDIPGDLVKADRNEGLKHADACLIAAAPDLLAACVYALETLEFADAARPLPSTTQMMLRIAIEKARGQP